MDNTYIHATHTQEQCISLETSIELRLGETGWGGGGEQRVLPGTLENMPSSYGDSEKSMTTHHPVAQKGHTYTGTPHPSGQYTHYAG